MIITGKRFEPDYSLYIEDQHVNVAKVLNSTALET